MCKRSLKAKLLSIVVAGSLIFSGISLGITSGSFLEPVEVQAAETTEYNLASNIQDGVVLHCFNWKYTDIIAELPNIAAAGFTSVQTSPAQVGFSSGIWWKLYQPLGFYVGTNDLGTKEDLARLCSEADKYGIKVIVDVVSNHLAGDHSNIQNDLKDGQYWHTYGSVSSWADRYQVVNGEIGMPDIKSEHSYVQQVVANYVNELKNLGVDGIRWDAAKHIALPSEGCNFWPTVTIEGLYHYGEILTGPDDRQTGNEGLMKEYTNYMTVTDSVYGKTLRDAFASGTVPTGYGNWSAKGIANNKLIYWAESHDTWSNNQDWGYSNGMSQNVIDRAYAVAACRDGASALYFSRPSSTNKDSIYAGQKGSTHFTSPEVSAINHFHNDMIGQKEYYTTGSNCAVVCREQGAVVVAGSGSNFSVTVPNGGSTTEAGTYVDAITGEKWTINSSTMSGKIGSTGIAVLYKEGFAPDLVEPVEPENPIETAGTVYYQNTNNWSDVYAYYWSYSNSTMTSWPGVKMTSVGNGVYSVQVPAEAESIIFNNGIDTQTEDLSLAGANKIYNNGSWSDYSVSTPVEPNDPVKPDDPVEPDNPVKTDENIFYKNTNNWSSVNAYYWSDSNTMMTAWPGEAMTNLGDGVYGIKVPEDAAYIIFNNGENSQTADLTLNGFYKIYNNGSWSSYGTTVEPEEPVVTPLVITSQPQDFTAKVGDIATFTVAATGEGLKYQWQYKALSGDWQNVSNATSATFTVVATEAMNRNQYRCVLYDSDSKTVTSSVATLTVNQLEGFVIASQPTDATVGVGGKATFAVIANSDSEVAYLWQVKTAGSNSWKFCSADVEGYFTSALKVTADLSLDGSQYRCILVNINGETVISKVATLNVDESVVSTSITKQPVDIEVENGDKFTLSIEATGTGLSYQWQYSKDGGKTWTTPATSAAKAAKYSATMSATYDGRLYRCVITDAQGNELISNAVSVSTGAQSHLSITSQPVDITAASGEKFTLSITATGTGLSYQWQYSKDGGKTWITPATSAAKAAKYSAKMNSTYNGRLYRCVVTDVNGSEKISNTVSVSMTQ